MSLTLHTLKPKTGSRQTRKRVGRGLSKKGSYSGRGVKGQRARSGGRSGLQLKGLRKIMLSMPKNRGFKSAKPKFATVNVGQLNSAFADGATVTPKAILKQDLVSSIATGVKILSDGHITVKLAIVGCQASASAKTKILAAGGSFKE